ncbi:MAG: hypothetical protein Q8P57_05135 [Candidatus Pacearchaeota archaeon]|nr:hypothetical protein [Candidatus Pacearchaeota archaeon]
MLTEKQILSAREHLERAQNPVFFYDNDVDGLCSYVLLRRFLGRGKGVAVKSHPFVDRLYAKKAQELNADYAVVLDRHDLGREFVEEMERLQIPIIWIDHHDVETEDYSYEDLFVFNPTRNKGKKKSAEPTTYLSYVITNRSEDMWVALIGCIADNYLPEFVDSFAERYPEYWSKSVEKAFDAYYGTATGRLVKALSFGIKDSITHVIQLQNLLISCKSPGDLEIELESSKPFGKKYKEVLKKYNLLMDRAKKEIGEKVLFFSYSGDLSISSDLSNELCYLYPDKTIVVAFSAGPFTNISLRGDNVKQILEEVISDFSNANGGGHRNAVGARIETKDLAKFKKGVEDRV